jgi:hypothetical protein
MSGLGASLQFVFQTLTAAYGEKRKLVSSRWRSFTRSRSGFGQLHYCDNPNDVWVEAVAVPLVVFNHIIY